MATNNLPDLNTFSHHTTVYIDPTKLDEWWTAFEGAREATIAEPQCLYFEVFEDCAEPGKITWVINWDGSPEMIEKNVLQKEHWKPFMAATQPLFVKPLEWKFLKREPGFVCGKKANFSPSLGKDNTGQAFQIQLEIRPECVDAWHEEIQTIWPLVTAEPECLYFEIFSDPAEPHKLCWMENWTGDLEWLQSVQLKKEYYKPYIAATEPMWVGERNFTMLRRKEGLAPVGKDKNFEGATIGDFR